ncbi:17010_t:CDS:2 [Acaulospora colombiana]|uniref:17010_t:CDS:1 n=1 Tax=Acaulospora colombiana TaxID=27376 RepID=A0ACA9KZN7_9GLOM|nr:17010_t:CDS:2 [Acaulospora colombiana]
MIPSYPRVVLDFEPSESTKKPTEDPAFDKGLDTCKGKRDVDQPNNGSKEIVKLSSSPKRNFHFEITNDAQEFVEVYQNLVSETEHAVQEEAAENLNNTNEERRVYRNIKTALKKLKDVMKIVKNSIKEGIQVSVIIRKVIFFLEKLGIIGRIMAFLEKYTRPKIINGTKYESLKDFADDVGELEDSVGELENSLDDTRELDQIDYKKDCLWQERVCLARGIIMAPIFIYERKQKKILYYKAISENHMLIENLLALFQKFWTTKSSYGTIGMTRKSINVESQEIIEQRDRDNLNVMEDQDKIEEITCPLEKDDLYIDELEDYEKIEDTSCPFGDDEFEFDMTEDHDKVEETSCPIEEDDFFNAESESNRNMRDLGEDFLKANCFIKSDCDQAMKGLHDGSNFLKVDNQNLHVSPRSFDRPLRLSKDSKKSHYEGKYQEIWSKFAKNIKVDDLAKTDYWIRYYFAKRNDPFSGEKCLLKAAEEGHAQYWYAYLAINSYMTETVTKWNYQEAMINHSGICKPQELLSPQIEEISDSGIIATQEAPTLKTPAGKNAATRELSALPIPTVKNIETRDLSSARTARVKNAVTQPSRLPLPKSKNRQASEYAKTRRSLLPLLKKEAGTVINVPASSRSSQSKTRPTVKSTAIQGPPSPIPKKETEAPENVRIPSPVLESKTQRLLRPQILVPKNKFQKSRIPVYTYRQKVSRVD